MGAVIGFALYIVFPDPYKLASIPVALLAAWIIFTC